MNRAKRYTGLGIVLGAVLAVSACGTGSVPIPQGTATVVPSVSAPAKETPKTTPKVSTCDAVREAFLTGTQAEIEAALKALVADKTADGTAREYADYYLVRDAKEPSLRDMDKTLIQTVCK